MVGALIGEALKSPAARKAILAVAAAAVARATKKKKKAKKKRKAGIKKGGR